jgi:hypothetical protein
LSTLNGGGQKAVFGDGSTYGASVQIASPLFEIPQVMSPADRRATSEYVVMTGGEPGKPLDTLPKTTSVMLGRTAWREVYGAPK